MASRSSSGSLGSTSTRVWIWSRDASCFFCSSTFSTLLVSPFGDMGDSGWIVVGIFSTIAVKLFAMKNLFPRLSRTRYQVLPLSKPRSTRTSSNSSPFTALPIFEYFGPGPLRNETLVPVTRIFLASCCGLICFSFLLSISSTLSCDPSDCTFSGNFIDSTESDLFFNRSIVDFLLKLHPGKRRDKDIKTVTRIFFFILVFRSLVPVPL